MTSSKINEKGAAQPLPISLETLANHGSNRQRDLRIAGAALQAQGLILIVGCLALSPGLQSIDQTRAIIVSAIIFLSILVYGLVLLKVGVEVYRGNVRVRKWAYLAAACCLFTRPMGLFLGGIALLCLIKGREAYMPSSTSLPPK